MGKESALHRFLFTEINPKTIGLFRVVFGFFALLEILHFYRTHLIEDYLIGPRFLFNYDLIPLSPLSEPLMNVLLLVVLLSTLLIMSGWQYRIGIITFFLGYSYFFLLDKSYYNNHLYLISLIAFLMIFIPADQAFSVGKKKKKKAMLSWHLRVIQAQMVIVYFFGGLAKLNPDWLVYHEPVKTLLTMNGIYSKPLAAFIVYGGAAFDLFIGFFLLHPRLRVLGAIGALVFNICNHLLFDDINIFPFLMMAALVIFFEVEKWPFFQKGNPSLSADPIIPKQAKRLKIALLIYFTIQIAMPLRHYFIPGPVDWTGEGQRFAWRMKIQARQIKECQFAVFDRATKKIYPVKIEQHIHPVQVHQMVHHPRMIIDFAHYLGKEARKSGVRDIMVKARIKVDFNQYKDVEVVSPDTDLLAEKWTWTRHDEWIKPLN